MGALSMKRLTRPDEPTAEGNLYGQNEQCLSHRGTSRLLTFPLLGSRRDTGLTVRVEGQSARERQGRPTAQPSAHILVREAPQRPEQGNEQQRGFGIDARMPAGTSG